MKTFKQTLFIITAVAGLSLAVSAQNGGDGKPPKKPDPPVIKPGKPTPSENPKKPGMSFLIAAGKGEEYAD